MTAEGPAIAPASAGTEPVLDVAHLGHVAIFTPRPEQSLAFILSGAVARSVPAKQGEVFRFEMPGQPSLALEFS